jgi:hypothetical protein
MTTDRPAATTDPEAASVALADGGLTTAQATALLEQLGPNLIPKGDPTPWWVRVGQHIHTRLE